MNGSAPPGDPGPDQDPALDNLLRDALQTTPLDPGALERLRVATEQAWVAAAGRRLAILPQARRRWVAALAMAAGIAGIAILGLMTKSPAVRGRVGTIALLQGEGLEVRWAGMHTRQLQVGDPLPLGEGLHAKGAALVALDGGGTLRIGAGTLIEANDQSSLTLRHGRLYVDMPPATATAPHLRISTRAGTVEHLGTEFEIMSEDQAVHVRVREGRIRLSNATGTFDADQGTELLAVAGAPVSRRPITTFGPSWEWVMSLAPRYELDGRPLQTYLQWASRELGRDLEIVDPAARRIVAATVLHGTDRGATLLDTLANVMATTTLAYEIQPGIIRVHSQP